ncbi:MAG: hypothetical protein ACE5E0_04665 [Terriglobia bacterium]
MNDEQWDRVVDKIDETYGIERKNVDKVDRTTTESFVFVHPSGEIKIERITRPLVVDEKRFYTKRAGTEADVEYVYSDTEFTHRVNLYIRDGTSWRQIDFKGGTGLF